MGKATFTKLLTVEEENDRKLAESLLDALFDNINKLPSSITLKSMKEFHLNAIEIIGKLEVIENKYIGDTNGTKIEHTN